MSPGLYGRTVESFNVTGKQSLPSTSIVALGSFLKLHGLSAATEKRKSMQGDDRSSMSYRLIFMKRMLQLSCMDVCVQALDIAMTTLWIPRRNMIILASELEAGADPSFMTHLLSGQHGALRSTACSTLEEMLEKRNYLGSAMGTCG